MGHLPVRTTRLYIRPQRQCDGRNKITKEFFALLNIDSMNIPDDSLNQSLVIQYEICCSDVQLPDNSMVQQWKQLENIFKKVTVIYTLLYTETKDIHNPVCGSNIDFKILEKDPLTKKTRIKTSSSSSWSLSPYGYLRSLMEGGCPCRKITVSNQLEYEQIKVPMFM
jgi:hypothetical protein